MKIDIENYDNMTPEEKIAALEENFASVAQHKANADKAASEAANYKKQLRERMTEDEAKATKEAEEKAALVARVEELERERAVNSYVNSYLGIGYDEKMAKSTAEALVKGDMVTVFANQKAFADAREKALRAELLKQTPTPPAGGEPTLTREHVAKMTMSERIKFYQEHPDEYKEIYGGN